MKAQRTILSILFLFVIFEPAFSQKVTSDDCEENAEKSTSGNFYTIYTSYSFISFTGDLVDDYMGFSNASGVVFGWTGGWRISKSVPLFLGVGTNLRYSHSEKGIIMKGIEDNAKSDFMSLTVPVNSFYKYTFSNIDGMALFPYFGLHLSANLFGTSEVNNIKYNHFKDDGFIIEKAKRFQLGWQVGVDVHYKMLCLGIGYFGDLTEYANKIYVGGLTVSIGFNI